MPSLRMRYAAISTASRSLPRNAASTCAAAKLAVSRLLIPMPSVIESTWCCGGEGSPEPWRLRVLAFLVLLGHPDLAATPTRFRRPSRSCME